MQVKQHCGGLVLQSTSCAQQVWKKNTQFLAGIKGIYLINAGGAQTDKDTQPIGLCWLHILKLGK